MAPSQTGPAWIAQNGPASVYAYVIRNKLQLREGEHLTIYIRRRL
jgi:hypothetical protein